MLLISMHKTGHLHLVFHGWVYGTGLIADMEASGVCASLTASGVGSQCLGVHAFVSC